MDEIRISATSESLNSLNISSILSSDGIPDHIEVKAEKGETFLQIIRRGNFPDFHAPCGGSGICGKCRTKILSGEVSPLSSDEEHVLSKEEQVSGIRLACRSFYTGTRENEKSNPADIKPVHILIQETKGSQISTDLNMTDVRGDFRFKLMTPIIPAPTLEDQRSILERLETSDGNNPERGMNNINTRMLEKLAKLNRIESTSYKEKLLFDSGKLVDIIGPGEKALGMAIDIGTTTIVVHMIDLITGKTESLRSGLNAQRICGADVISRINYCSGDSGKIEEMKNLIVTQLDEAILSLLQERGYEGDWVKTIAIAGNTTMLHLLLGVDASGIAAAPFIPVFIKSLKLNALQAGFSSAPQATLELLPSVAAYVGADITAGIGISEIDSRDWPVLFIDIGTNGEMALAWNGRIICCSTAAGPAFEGANISRGTGGIPGAIDRVRMENSKLSWSTINELPPIGICGSGIIDAAALLVETEAADYTGRILSSGESGFSWIADMEDGASMRLKCGHNEDILFTQKDMREVQLAKAAIAGGIRTLVKEAGLELEDIGEVVLAGGFGSYIDPESAGKIGLLPGNLAEITRTAGNTSGAGAVKVMLEAGKEKKYSSLAASCEYIELSSNPDFQNFYIDEMCFPEIETV